jgi:hypothetical protein
MSEPNFFEMDRITVPLTYLFTEPPTAIRFFCKLALSNDDAAARQAFYSKPDADQQAGQHAYNVDFLARITVKAPEGLPGFDDFVRETIAREANAAPAEATPEGEAPKPKLDPATIVTGNLSDARIRELLAAFLADDNPMKRKVAADAIQLYNRYTQPPEFFR